MSRLRKILSDTLRSNKRFKLSLVLISTVWYLALFPGRLGFDYSEAIRIMQRGESTDWWTASFWWYLKLSTFNGRTIVVSSLISLIILGYSLFYLCESLRSKHFTNRLALLIIFCSPIYGGFGVNISHDTFVAAGLIVFTGYHIRIFQRQNPSRKLDYLPIFFASVLVVTTHYGVFLVAANTLLLLCKRKFKVAAALPLVSIGIILISSLGVTQVPKYGPILVIMGDLKCVAQHPMAEIAKGEWELLISLAPKSEWLAPTKCSFVDDALRALPSLDLNRIKLD